MTALSDHTASKFVKLLYIGDSGTGKTGSLASLVDAGYKLRILDLDNNITVLREFINKDYPAKIGQVDYVTCRDDYVSTPGGAKVKGNVPKAYVAATKLMTKWPDETIPAEWGEDTVFVMDSLSALGRSAYEWAKGMNPGAKDKRQWYHEAQNQIEIILSMLTSESFQSNVVVISHVLLAEDKFEVPKAYVNSIGKALGPIIPRYFESLILAEISGTGLNAKRRIRTVPTNLITLKTPAPFKIDETLPLETGLATLFKNLKEL